MPRLTDERLAELRRIAEAATPPNEQCPRCGVPWALGRDVGGRVHTPGGMDCLRRQLAQAQERERAALAHNAQLRELLDRYQWSADGCPECGEFESDVHAEWCEIAAALADAPDKPENPLAAYTDGQLYDELQRRGWVAATWAQEGAKKGGGNNE